MSTSELESMFIAMWPRLCRLNGIEPVEPEREFCFYDGRSWRFDFAWPSHKVAVEIEGGVWVGGRHGRGVGLVADMDKYNQAARLGWAVLRFAGQHLRRDPQGVFETIVDTLNQTGRGL